MSEQSPASIPITVLTGFLGSGKTTLLNQLLGHAEMDKTAVLINEFGEISLDHLLVRRILGDIIQLSSGCLCCTMRGDLSDSLRELYVLRRQGKVPPFRRVMVETTGLADPIPILQTLMTDPIVVPRYHLEAVVTTVDAVFGARQLSWHGESAKQVAVADRLVMTKRDLADKSAVAALTERVRRLNPAAPLVFSEQGGVEPRELFGCGPFDPTAKSQNVRRWLNKEAYDERAHDHPHDVNRHDDGIDAFCVSLDAPIAWKPFAAWMEALVSSHGDHLLRIKGVLNVIGQNKPVVIHGVQHVLYPPAILEAWPDDDRRSRLVFITHDLKRRYIEASLSVFRSDLGSA